MSKRQIDNYDRQAEREGKAIRKFYQIRVKPIRSLKASRQIVFGGRFDLAR